jgi:hypothetical protein
MAAIVLTPGQEAQAQRWAAVLLKKAPEEVLQIARVLVAKPDGQLLGPPNSGSASGPINWRPTPSKPL